MVAPTVANVISVGVGADSIRPQEYKFGETGRYRAAMGRNEVQYTVHELSAATRRLVFVQF